jgi:anaerobic selenocysteine-containing dehydrogenase
VSIETRKTTCNRDCPDACGIVATVENGKVTRLRGDAEHPVTRGFLCYRTNQFLNTQYSSERLTTPLLRKNGTLSPVGWDEALDFVARELIRIRDESGPASIFHYRSGGSLGLLKVLCDYFFSLFGPATTKRGDICSGAGEAAQELDFGESDSSDLSTLLESRHIVLWGKNLVTSSPHTLTVVREARARGSQVVLIDPVHQATVKHCDRFVQPRPGGVFALALAVARILFDEGGADPDAARYCDHLDEFRELSQSRSVEDWCREADVPIAEAVDLARRLADRPTAILVGWGMGRRTNGGAIVRALDALAAVSGNLGIRGGGASFYFGRRGAFDLSFAKPAPPPRTVCEPRFGAEIAALRDPPVRALWVTCGNPVTMLPDSEATVKALESLDLVVVVDSFLTDTARLATVVLPTTTLLEADDILGSYGHHYLGVARPVVAPPDGVKSDLEIVQALAERVGLGGQLAGTAREWQERFVSTRLAAHGVGLSDLERGFIKNPLSQEVLFADRKFRTPSGKVNLLSEAPPSLEPTPEGYPLWLLTLSTPKSQSSQWAVDTESPPTLTVHPNAAHGLTNGSRCLLESRVGSMVVQLRFDEAQRKDVALLPKGGHRTRGACGNSLVRARLTDLGEGGALYEEAVRIVPLTE